MPSLTRGLIIANVIAFVLTLLLGDDLIGWGALWPLGSGLFLPWQVLSYAFLHDGLAHLAFNMFGLWMFGSELERIWGSRRLAAFYTASVLTAAVTQLAVTSWMDSNVPTIGASGGIFGLMLGFATVFPNRKIVPLLPPIPMPAWLFVTLYGVIELTLGVTGSQAGIAHFAHLGGLVGGWLMIRFWRRQPPFW